jgi:N-acyl homoserine lactone hydrolase
VTAKPGLWRIKAVDTGSSIIEKSIITYMHDFGTPIRIPRVVWVIEGETTIVVDASVPRDGKPHEFIGEQFERSPEQEPEAALRLAGVDFQDVEHVILTHLHWDHAGNCDLFPEARLWAQGTEYRYAMAPGRFFRKSFLAPLSGWEYPPPYVLPNLCFVEGETELVPGIRLVPVPGHTPGSQAVLVDTEDGIYCIAGDAVMSYENLDHDLPPGFHVHVDDSMDSMDLLRRRATHILPSHDYKLFGGERVAEFPRSIPTVASSKEL